MSSTEVKIFKPELTINKKLGSIKFEQAFDTTSIGSAEKVVIANEEVFKGETLKDYSALGQMIGALKQDEIDSEQYKKLSSVSFSIKSRAETGGFPLASVIANSLYKFCDKASEKIPLQGYKVLKLHYDALVQVFENKFPNDDTTKSQKLIAGLEAISDKFINE